MPFENTNRLPDVKLNEMRPYKKKLVKNNIMTDLYVDQKQNKNTNALNYSLGSIPKKMLKENSNVLY